MGSASAPASTGASFGITASFPSRNRCRPSPCARAFPGPKYYGGSVPPRPDRPTKCPARQPVLATRRPGRTRAVPAFTVIRSTKEEPSSIPAASPRLPRSTSPWPPGPPPTSLPGSSPPRSTGTGAHRARPLSARFEPVYLSRDVVTPVPRVLLFITLAGPAPSGDTDTSRRCQGCSHPPRHLPDQAALSFPVPAATGPAAKVSHLRSNHQRLAAHADPDTDPRHRRASHRTWGRPTP